MSERTMPEPRLLTRDQAAAYCGVGAERFEQSCTVPPIRCFGTKKLWDRKALDRWLDQLSGIDNAPRPSRSLRERLNGEDQRAGS